MPRRFPTRLLAERINSCLGQIGEVDPLVGIGRTCEFDRTHAASFERDEIAVVVRIEQVAVSHGDEGGCGIDLASRFPATFTPLLDQWQPLCAFDRDFLQLAAVDVVCADPDLADRWIGLQKVRTVVIMRSNSRLVVSVMVVLLGDDQNGIDEQTTAPSGVLSQCAA